MGYGEKAQDWRSRECKVCPLFWLLRSEQTRADLPLERQPLLERVASRNYLAPSRGYDEDWSKLNSSSDNTALDRPRPRKSPAHLLMVPVAFGIMGITCYGVVQLACTVASMVRSDIRSFASYHEPTKTLMVIPALFASIPVGFLVVNLLVYAVRPLRRFFDREAKERKGEDFFQATRQLMNFSKYWLPPLVAISLGAALFGK